MKTEEMGQLMKESEVFRDRELLYLEREILQDEFWGVGGNGMEEIKTNKTKLRRKI